MRLIRQMNYFKPKLTRMTTSIKAVTLSWLAQQYQAKVRNYKKLTEEKVLQKNFWANWGMFKIGEDILSKYCK